MLRAFLLPLALAAAIPDCDAQGKAANDNGGLPALTGRVVDDAGLLATEQEARLTARLALLEETTSDQFAVVTVLSLGEEPIESFSLRLGNHWGLGRKEFDNGVLLVVAPTERKVRIEVGIGLEGLLTNEKAGFIIRDQLLPAFREGRFPQGIEAGVERVIDVLEQDKRRPGPRLMEKAA